MSDNEQIGVLKWAYDEVERIHRFRRWFREQSLKDPEHFPVLLTPGEWDEQYRIWEDLPKKTGAV